jgi:hypothetical protein
LVFLKNKMGAARRVCKPENPPLPTRSQNGDYFAQSGVERRPALFENQAQ